MKILYVPGYYPFCYYYRGYLPGVYSNQMVTQDFMKVEDISMGNVASQALLADVVVFQRPTGEKSLELAKLLKLKGKKIIMENDDTYSAIPLYRLGNDKQREIAIEQGERLNNFCKLADGIIVTTQTLAEEYGKINPNVVVLKNCIDPLDEFTCKKNETGKFRVGFIGSVTSNDDYNHIKEQIKQLDERGDVTVVIMGVKHKDGEVTKGMAEDYDFWSTIKNIEWHPYCHVTEYMMTVASLALDVAIIPRKEHYFNECKSNIKFLEMSLLGIPVIAQGFSNGKSPYQGIDEPYMTVITDNATWYDTIIRVKGNYNEYKTLAIKARKYVLKNYNITKYAKEWTKQIKKLIK